MFINDITLVICAYNCERYIEQTLFCVANQTYQNFDLLIVNDCSTDRSVEKIVGFFKEHPRQYELINLEHNGGIGHARHFAERHAKTTYLIFVDADDLPYPTLVEKLYTKIKSDSDLMAVGCYLEYIDRNGDKIGGGLFLGEKTKEKFIEKAANKKLIFMQPTAIYERELSLSVGGYCVDGFPDGKPRYQDYCEDLDLWTRMSDLYVRGKAIIILPEVLCDYRKTGQGLSSSTLPMILKMRYVKVNLLRRRKGEKELTFVEFYDSLSPKELKAYQRQADAAVKLREGVMRLKQGKILTATANIVQSVWSDPKYLWQKIKSNSGIFK